MSTRQIVKFVDEPEAPHFAVPQWEELRGAEAVLVRHHTRAAVLANVYPSEAKIIEAQCDCQDFWEVDQNVYSSQVDGGRPFACRRMLEMD